MMNIRNIDSKESLGVNFKDGICIKVCLKLWCESDWYYCVKMVLKAALHKQSPKQSFPKKVTVQKPIAELWTVISEEMIKYQLTHAQFDQISDINMTYTWIES